MKAGRELDVLIAEKVMGGSVMDYNNYGNYEVSFDNDSLGHAIWEAVPPYSTDIATAWQVVDKLFTLGFDTEIQLYQLATLEKHYRVAVARILKQEETYLEFSKSAPHAICLAALKAVGSIEP